MHVLFFKNNNNILLHNYIIIDFIHIFQLIAISFLLYFFFYIFNIKCMKHLSFQDLKISLFVTLKFPIAQRLEFISIIDPIRFQHREICPYNHTKLSSTYDYGACMVSIVI